MTKPIMAYLRGSDVCVAEGLTVKAHAPALEMARRLLQIGIDPDRPMYCFRDGEIAVKFRSLRWAADRTADDGHSPTRFVRVKGRQTTGDKKKRTSDAARPQDGPSSGERPEPSPE